jgi:hypothetical protein
MARAVWFVYCLLDVHEQNSSSQVALSPPCTLLSLWLFENHPHASLLSIAVMLGSGCQNPSGLPAERFQLLGQEEQ